MATACQKPIFRDLNPDDEDPQVTEMESLCMNCYETGSTRLMLTRIPFYKEVVVMSFSCQHCGYANNELKDGGAISPNGVKLTLTCNNAKDLNRRVVRSDFASVAIPQVELELPALSQKGEVTTVEGILDRVVTGLQQDQVLRRIQHPEDAEKIDQFILKLVSLKDIETNGPFTIIVEDISGNSHIENPIAPRKDPNCCEVFFDRTTEQDHQLGIFTHSEVDDKPEEKVPHNSSLLVPISEGEHSLADIQSGEVMSFRTNCPDCNCPCDTNMKVTAIPHFKEVVIMATNCEQCGHRTNEVKSGGGIEELGVKIELKIRSREDFSRDILKSDTCSLLVPELELESGPRSLCGRFTTAEGLLRACRDQLAGKDNLLVGDSADKSTASRMESFISKLDDVIEGHIPVTLILDDPAGNSYVQTLADDGSLDDGLTITKYIRSFDQNEELGLNDMKTEDY